MVYKWYTVVYNVSFVIGLIGYCIVLFVFFGISELFSIAPGFIQVGILFLSYGLYFG
jgi:RING finger protein 121